MSLGDPGRWRRLVAHRIGGPVIAFSAAGSGYVVLALLGYQLVGSSSAIASFWPPNGWIVALLVLAPRRLRAWVIAAVLPGELVADFLHRIPVLTALGWGTTNLVEASLVAWLLVRVARKGRLGTAEWQPFRPVLALTTAAFAAPFATGLAGAAVSQAAYGGSYGEAWLTWWLGDATGILLVVPLVLPLVQPRGLSRPWQRPTWLLEVALIAGLAVALFGFTSRPLEFLMPPLVVLLAVKHGLRLTAAASILVATIATICTGRGLGPFASLPPLSRVLGLQAFIATSASVAFLINAAISERRRAEAALSELAMHDPLTGLANRRWFMERLDYVSARRDRSSERAAVVYLDLDHFKEINDRLGHAAGDAVLIEVGRRLAAAVRASDVVARVGGDEFAALLEPVEGTSGAELSASRIAGALNGPFTRGEVVIPIAVSVGASLVGADSDLSLTDADRRLYRDKRSNKHTAVAPVTVRLSHSQPA